MWFVSYIRQASDGFWKVFNTVVKDHPFVTVNRWNDSDNKHKLFYHIISFQKLNDQDIAALEELGGELDF